MLIVCEGPDGSGKSTLLQHLRVRLARDYTRDEVHTLHSGPPERDPLEEYEIPLDWYRPGFGHHLLVDRLHWGELVYGPMLRGASQLSAAGFWHVEAFLRSRGAVVVHVTAERTQLWARCRQRGEDFVTLEQVEDARKRFYDVASISTAVTTLVDTGAMGGGYAHVDRLVDTAVQREKAVLPLEPYPTYVGPPKPQVLLVGEKRGNVQQEFITAFAPLPQTSGRYLLDTVLESKKLPVQSLGLTNALEGNIHGLWTALDEPRVVTLGDIADKVTFEAGVPSIKVPHPQHQRRFHYHERDEYREKIEIAAGC